MKLTIGQELAKVRDRIQYKLNSKTFILKTFE